jgi:hypothetical protein
MCVNCAPTERGKQSTDGSYKHLAPTEPGKTVLIERSLVLVQRFLQFVTKIAKANHRMKSVPLRAGGIAPGFSCSGIDRRRRVTPAW